jgi:hypothetical protein
MRISYWPNSVAQNGKEPYDAFLCSLRESGYQLVKESMDADAAVIWSVLWHGRMAPNHSVWKAYRSNCRPMIVTEVGGIKRGTTWKVGLNGINRNGDYIPSGNNNDRARSLGLTLNPWRSDGEYILVCGQHNKSLQWQGMPSMSNWFLQIYDDIRKHTDRPIIFRPHPRCRLPEIERGLKYVYRQDPVHVSGTYDNFNLAFDNIWATVSWSSNPGIHSVIAGVPAVVGPDSLAFDVAVHNLADIENRYAQIHNRDQWLNDFAWTEFTVEELSSGLPLSRLRNTLHSQIINAVI